jgi:DNA replication protein DnaC
VEVVQLQEEFKPELSSLLADENLKETEKSQFTGCTICDAGYVNGNICDCLKLEIMKRRYVNANINYDFASLPIIDSEVEAYLKVNNERKPINLNKLVKSYVNSSKQNLETGNGIIFNGPTGRGKSLTAMKILMKLCDKGFSCYFITVKQFLELIKKSWEDEDAKKTLNYIYNCDFLVCDDLGTELHKTDWTVTELDSLFRDRYFKKKPILLTTNSSVNDLKEKYAQRIVSLFHERLMFVAVVTKEDYREKTAKIPSYINLEELQDE